VSELLRRWLSIRSERRLRAWLISITLIILVFKLLIIPYPWPELPPESCVNPPIDGGRCGFIFDEAHYIPAVRKVLRGEAANNEHPPLSKALMMLGILIFGDNPYGWRTFITICGAASVYLVGLLAYELTKSLKASVIAAALFGFDIMSFNLSSIAMLDAPALAFSLLGAYLYLRKRRVLSGLAFGLALLSKLSTTFILFAILLYDLAKTSYEETSFRGAMRRWIGVIEKTCFTAIIILIIGLGIYDYSYGAFQTPFEHLDFMLNYHSGLTFSEGDVVDTPLSWTNPIFQFPRASYFVVAVQVDSLKTYHPIAYYGMQTPLWWMTWIVFIFAIYLAYTRLRAGKFPDLELFMLCWLLTNYLIYFPLAHILHRWVYSFYFYNSVPIIAVAISRLLEGERLSELILYLLLAGQICFFLYFFPVKPQWYIDFLLWLGLPA
jgi:predicted membrane-bound dolichyl-phosphate-mannose-protein mannosyltransferase